MKHIKNNTKKYFTGFSTLIILTALIIYFSGCNDSVTNSTAPTPHYQAHSEQEFVTNPNLKAIPEAVTIVNLEHQNSPADSIPDTGTRGEDVIPYIYAETATYNFSLGDSSKFKAKLIKDSGEILFEISPSDNSVSVTIPAGSYKLYLTSLIDYSIGLPALCQNVFIQQGKNYFNRTAGEEFIVLINTGNCPGCDLSFSYLRGMVFSECNLHGANLSYADLRRSSWPELVLTNAYVVGADLDSASFSICTFDASNFSNTNWDNSLVFGSTFTHSILTGASFRYSSFSGNDFTGTNFIGVDFCQMYGKLNSTNGVISDSTTKCWPPVMP